MRGEDGENEPDAASKLNDVFGWRRLLLLLLLRFIILLVSCNSCVLIGVYFKCLALLVRVWWLLWLLLLAAELLFLSLTFDDSGGGGASVSPVSSFLLSFVVAAAVGALAVLEVDFDFTMLFTWGALGSVRFGSVVFANQSASQTVTRSVNYYLCAQ